MYRSYDYQLYDILFRYNSPDSLGLVTFLSILFYRIDRNVSFFQGQKIQNLDAIEMYRFFLN
jgi:hypothetical protein